MAGLLSPAEKIVGTARRRWLSNAVAQIGGLKVTVVVAFCLGLLISMPLWIGPRSYPLAPALSFLPAPARLFELALFATLFALAAAILVLPRPRGLVASFLAAVVLFCVFDQTRWQPWVALYVFLLATLSLYSWRDEDAAGRRRALDIARLIMAATYFFAGVQKLNWNFIDIDFPQMMTPLTERLPALAPPLHAFGMAAPLIEAAFGVGLLTRRFRRVSLLAALAMHGLILAMLGPLGQNWNMVVWPWTAAMAAIDIVLFADGTPIAWRELFRRGHALYPALVVLVFGVLPFLSFVNRWDSYWSAGIYSGNVTEAMLYTSDAGRASLPPDLRRAFVPVAADTNIANVQRWAFEDLKVTPYPETRVYKAIARAVCARLADPRQFVLMVYEHRLFFSAPETGYRCDQL